MRPTPSRAGHLATVLGLLLALVGLALPMSSAQAAGDTYQYWGYWTLKDSSWTFSQKGPAKTNPADGSVEGWRWAVSGTSGNRHPRGTVTFKQVCGDTPAKDGAKRVAVVVDYGRKADASKGTPPAPVAECASVPTDATGSDVLAAVSTVRTSGGMVCGIDDWPASGCGGAVKNPTKAQKAPDQSVDIAIAGAKQSPAAGGDATRAADTPSKAAAAKSGDDAGDSSSTGAVVGWIVGAAVIVLILIGLLIMLRRRRAAVED